MKIGLKAKTKANYPLLWSKLASLYHRFLILKRPLYLLNPNQHWDKFLKDMEKEHRGLLKNLYDLELALLIKEIKKTKPESILEIGCGYGRILKALSEDAQLKNKKLAGIDFSQKMIGVAKRKLPKGLRLVCADATERLPFFDNEFDIVFSWQSLMHIPPGRINNSLKEISRVAGKYIIHGENLNVSFRTFKHNYLGYYKKEKNKILLNIKNPIKLRTKMKLEALLFLKIKKQR